MQVSSISYSAGNNAGVNVKQAAAAIFRRNIFQSIGASGVSFGMTLVTTPLMTRLFPTEAYGVNGMMLTGATVVSTVGLFGLPVALARMHAEKEQIRLLHASVQISVMLLFVCVLVASLGLLWLSEMPIGITAVIVLLFPILVLAHASQRIADSLAIARGLFPPQAAARISNSATARGITLLFGWLLHAGAAVMVLGDMLGKLVHIVVIVRGCRFDTVWRNLQWRPQLGSLRRVLFDYRDFALHSNMAAVLPLATAFGLQLLIANRFGTAATGQYVLALSILSLPVSLITMATAPVLFHRLVHAADEEPNRLMGLALKSLLAYLLVGVLTMLPIALFGPVIFSFAFGESWRLAGAVAALLCLPQALAMSLPALLSLFRVSHRIRAWFWFELVGAILMLGGFAWLSSATDLVGAAYDLAMLGISYQLLMHIGCIWAAKPRLGGSQQ